MLVSDFSFLSSVRIMKAEHKHLENDLESFQPLPNKVKTKSKINDYVEITSMSGSSISSKVEEHLQTNTKTVPKLNDCHEDKGGLGSRKNKLMTATNLGNAASNSVLDVKSNASQRYAHDPLLQRKFFRENQKNLTLDGDRHQMFVRNISASSTVANRVTSSTPAPDMLNGSCTPLRAHHCVKLPSVCKPCKPRSMLETYKISGSSLSESRVPKRHVSPQFHESRLQNQRRIPNGKSLRQIPISSTSHSFPWLHRDHHGSSASIAMSQPLGNKPFNGNGTIYGIPKYIEFIQLDNPQSSKRSSPRIIRYAAKSA